jgi:hypothetical protein
LKQEQKNPMEKIPKYVCASKGRKKGKERKRRRARAARERKDTASDEIYHSD